MLEKLLQFTKLLDEFRAVERVVRVTGQARYENDTEHSYNLAMLAWYLVSSTKINLDQDKVIRYALVHDFLEVYAGDTYIYSENAALLASKHAREAAAIVKLRETLAEFPDLHATIDAYESRKDAESRFVYALDKIEPILHMYLDGGRTWKEEKVDLGKLYESKRDKVALSPEVKSYFDELMTLLQSKETELFGGL
ncbi:MAG: HD domain-containing protein [Candidatus Moraniibacteriota bacterium]|nr:MAG: HD domain-containing protein [Candidatus Moranbacteria bacterium]